jgi:hypothetical protein
VTTKKAETVSEVVTRRGIQEVVHFTTNWGLLGCLAKGGLLPRSKLSKEQLLEHILKVNAPFRTEAEPWFDKTERWIDFVNLSITEISTNLFKHSMKWHPEADLFWVVLSFSPDLMSDEGVYFTTTNNIYERTKRNKGAAGLELLFAPVIQRKRTWSVSRKSRPDHLPTCEQAEVLYPDFLNIRYLRKVYCRNGEESDRVYVMLSNYDLENVPIVVSEDKFRGAAN